MVATIFSYSDPLVFIVRDFTMKKFPLDVDPAASLSIASAIGAIEQQGLLTSSSSSSDSDSSSLETVLGALRSSSSMNVSISGSGAFDSLTAITSGLGGKRALKLMSQSQKAKLVPFKANDPMVLNRSQWFHERVQDNFAWLITTGKSITTRNIFHDVW